jgi:predicted GNAT family acetyltransferase
MVSVDGDNVRASREACEEPMMNSDDKPTHAADEAIPKTAATTPTAAAGTRAAAGYRPFVVRDRTDSHRYIVDLEGQTAFLQYERTLNTISLVHTEVPTAFRGRGVASALTRFALEAARAEDVVVVPRCPFVQAYIRRHPEFAALLG